MNFDPPALLHGWVFMAKLDTSPSANRVQLFYLGKGLTHSLGFDKKSYKENYIWTLV